MTISNTDQRSHSSSAVASRGAESVTTEARVTAPVEQGHAADGAPAQRIGHVHEGGFAAGQARFEHHPERPASRRNFAEGQARQQHINRGGFAAGQRTLAPRDETPGYRGDFAAGQRRTTP
jgi:hypothetical protein